MASERAFRAQLVIPEQRYLFDHWCRLAGDRAMPARRDICPSDVVRMLPNISLIDISATGDKCKYRLAGTALRDMFEREVTGLDLSSVYDGERLSYWLSVCRRAAESSFPTQGAATAPITGRSHVVWFWLRLPLSDDGRRVDRILGHDVALPCHIEKGWSPATESQAGSHGAEIAAV